MQRYRIEWKPNGLYLLWSYGGAWYVDRTYDRNVAAQWARNYGIPMPQKPEF